MKKIFTLAAAILASVCMWAGDPDLETKDWGADDFATVIANHDGITLSTSVTEWSGNFSGTQYIALGSSTDLSAESPAPYVAVSAGEAIDSIEVYWAPNGTDASNIAWAAWTDANNLAAQDVDFLDQTAEYTGSKTLAGATWQKISFGEDVHAVMLTRQLKKAKIDDTVQSNIGKNKTINILGIRVWLHSSKTVVSTVETLTAVRINGEPMPAEALADLLANHSYDMLTEFAEAPVISFNKHTVITYDDSSSKEKDELIDVTATEASAGIWHAAATIGGIEYAINAVKPVTYTVTYYNGETVVGTEVVAAGLDAQLYSTLENQPLSEFVAWYIDAEMQTEVPAIDGWTINEDRSYYGKWNKAYAASLNIEQYILSNGMNNLDNDHIGDIFKAVLDGAHYAYENVNALDSLNDSKTNRNYAYLGMKIKKTEGYFAFNLAQGSTANIRFGNVGKAFVIKVNGVELDQETTSLANTAVDDANVFSYTAEGADVLIEIYGCAENKTLVLKQIMINEPIAPITLPTAGMFTVTVAELENGTIEFADLGNPNHKYADGDTVHLIITPAEGYKVVSANAGNEALIPDENGNCSFAMPAQDVTVSATFEADVPEPELYTVTIAEVENGTIIFTDLGNDEHKYAEGDEVHLNITPAEGYKVVSANAGNEALVLDGEGNCKFTMPGQDVTVSATFEPISEGLDDINADVKAVKRIENGMLIIEKNGRFYNVFGARVK